MENMNSIYIVEMIYCDDDEQTNNPISIQRHILGYFSNFENSLQFIKFENNDGYWFSKKCHLQYLR